MQTKIKFIIKNGTWKFEVSYIKCIISSKNRGLEEAKSVISIQTIFFSDVCMKILFLLKLPFLQIFKVLQHLIKHFETGCGNEVIVECFAVT